MRNVKKIAWMVVVLIIILQFIPVDRSIPSNIQTEHDLLATNPADPATKLLLKSACYDCHSYETEYPWYSYTAPAKWFLQDHIREGREHLNFSVWGTYSKDDRQEFAEELQEEIDEGEMPLPSYLWTHADAKLDKQKKAKLIQFFRTLN